MNKPHWPNPWKDVVYVPIEELVECAYGLGKNWGDINGHSFIMTKENMLAHWKSAGNKLDAYILPCASGYHSIGIRYGSEGHEYLSPAADQDKTKTLLRKYT